jgi:hypothetical protein
VTFHGFGTTVDRHGFGTDACATGTAAKADVRITATKVNLFFTTPPFDRMTASGSQEPLKACWSVPEAPAEVDPAAPC